MLPAAWCGGRSGRSAARAAVWWPVEKARGRIAVEEPFTNRGELEPVSAALGTAIRALREQRKLTRRQVAARSDLSEETIRRIELLHSVISNDALPRVGAFWTAAGSASATPLSEGCRRCGAHGAGGAA